MKNTANSGRTDGITNTMIPHTSEQAGGLHDHGDPFQIPPHAQHSMQMVLKIQILEMEQQHTALQTFVQTTSITPEQ